jgi:protein TonB
MAVNTFFKQKTGMKHLIAIVLLCTATHAVAQSTAKTDTAKAHAPVFMYVEQMPTQSYDLNKYVSEHIKYPNEARENNVEGRVIVKFVVNEDGTLSDVTVVRGIGAGCDEEAVRMVRSMPSWNAAKQGGNKVKCYYTLPVIFKLEYEKK